MKSFNRIFAAVLICIALIFTAANFYLITDNSDNSRPYRVEINRIAEKIKKSGEIPSLYGYTYVTAALPYDGSESFFSGSSCDYSVREIKGTLYRFDYTRKKNSRNNTIVLKVNVILSAMSLLIISVMLFIRLKILKPFEIFGNIPYELSKGNLTAPVAENKNRFFGKFLWGVDMLRENIEQNKYRELNLQKEKKTLILSVSHDIKTPLSAIKLYSKAISKGLYDDKKKQIEIAESINQKADEIDSFITQIIEASRDDFLNIEVKNDEFYLSELISKIEVYYKDKLSVMHTRLSVTSFSDCIISGDLDRSIEVLQNIMENAVKYGNGSLIEISFSEEDDCQLVTIKNSGCTLPETELPHIFDSFWRGSNSGKADGSGLGLYICRQLMRKMKGEVFAEIFGECMSVTVVFTKA